MLLTERRVYRKIVSVPTVPPAARFKVPLSVRMSKRPNVVAPKMLMVPPLLTMELPNPLLPDVFQVPRLVKLFAPPVIDKVPVTKPEAPFVKDVPKNWRSRLPTLPVGRTNFGSFLNC